MCHVLVQLEILRLVDRWVSNRLRGVRNVLARPIAVLFSILRCVPSDMTRDTLLSLDESITLRWAKTLEEAYKKLAPHKDAYRCGLAFMCVQLAALLGRATFVTEQGSHLLQGTFSAASREIYPDAMLITSVVETVQLEEPPDLEPRWSPEERTCNLVSHWARLAIHVSRSGTNATASHSRHLFVSSVDAVFQVMQARLVGGHPAIRFIREERDLLELLVHMAYVLRWALANRVYNCGSYTRLSWIRHITGCYKVARARHLDLWSGVPLSGRANVWPVFRLVLALLKACLEQRLFTEGYYDDTIDETDYSSFELLLDLLDRPDLPQLRPELCKPSVDVERSWAEHVDGVSAMCLRAGRIS